MRNPLLNKPLFLNIIILIISGFVSTFTLLFGIAHLIEGITQLIKGTDSNIPPGESMLGAFMVFLLCVIGIFTLIMVIASIKAIIHKFKKE